MQSKARSAALPSLSVLLFTLVPAIALARCGIWPTFPDRGGDASTDGGMHTDARTDGTTGPDVRDAASDIVPMDAGNTFGFRECTTQPGNGPFVISRLASVPNFTRDLAFDGDAAFVTATTDILQWDTGGTSTALAGGALGFTARSIRYLANGMIVAVTTEPAVRLYDPTGMAVTTLGSGFSYLNGLAVDPSGAIYFSDTAISPNTPAIRRATTDGTINMVTTAISVPTGLALTPDNRHLFVASSGHGVYYIDLDESGNAVGAPHMYFSEPLNGYGLAFDECGYLYVSDTDRGRILRSPPGGGTFEAIQLTVPDGGTIGPGGIAFGRGMFDTTSLYFVNVLSPDWAVYRVPLNVRGAAIVAPH